jgi:hypothetical protein
VKPIALAALAILGAVAAPAGAQAPAVSKDAPTALAKPAQLPADSMDLGRRYTRWLYAGQVDSLVARHTADARADTARLAASLRSALADLTARAGTETQVVEERFVTRNGRRQYWRTARFSSFAEPVMVRWIILPSGEIMGLGMNPASQAPPVDPP